MTDIKEDTEAKKSKVMRKVMTNQMKQQYVKEQTQKKKEEKETPNTYAVEKVETVTKSAAYDGEKAAVQALQYGKQKLIGEIREKKAEAEQTIRKQGQPPSCYEKLPLSSSKEQLSVTEIAFQQKETPTKTSPKGRVLFGNQMANQAQKQGKENAVAMEQWRSKLKKKAQRQFRGQAIQRQEGKAKRLIKTVLSLEKIMTVKVKQISAALFASGSALVLVVMVLLFGVVSALITSPFGVFFANEDTTADTVAISQVVTALNADFADQVEEIIESNPHDSMTLDGDMADWTDVIAVFAVWTAGRDDNTAMDVVTIDRERQERIKAVFVDMNQVSYDIEVIRHGRGEDSWTERILHITIESKTANQMADIYGFTEGQKEILAELLQERALLQSLVGSLTVSTVEARNILRSLPEDLPAERRAVIETAMQLVGKVNYFWGGKSSAIGWDSRWGIPTKVTAEGSSATGKIRAYGLDCSGYVDWVFHNSLGYVVGQGGGAASQHRNCTPVSWENAEIGDLVFYADDSHVGIVAGWNGAGEILIVHCAAGYNNVVITGKEGFSSVGRPRIYE